MTAPRASRPSSAAPRRRSRAAVPAESDASDVLIALFNSVGELHDTLERIYRPARLNKQKFVVLTALARQAPEPSLATQLAGTAGVTRSSMTTLLDDLEQRGWIERRRDVRDRRAIQIRITDAGRALVDAAAAHFRDVCARLIQKTDTTQLAHVARRCEVLAKDARALSRCMPPFPSPAKT